MLAPDVVLLSDGGGKVSAARRSVVTADKVACLLIGLTTKATGTWRLQPAMVNGRFAALVFVDGRTGLRGRPRWSSWTAALVLVDGRTGLRGRPRWSSWTAALVFVDGTVETVGTVEIQCGLVSAVYLAGVDSAGLIRRNPDKLGGVAATRSLHR